MKYYTPINLPKTHPTINNQPSMTKQEFKDECDPTTILAKYQRTGLLEHHNQYQPVYGEQSSMTYHEALTIKTDAETMFQDLPSSVRKKFGQSVGAYLDFISNPENLEDITQDKLSSQSTKKNEEETSPDKEVSSSQPNEVETPS